MGWDVSIPLGGHARGGQAQVGLVMRRDIRCLARMTSILEVWTIEPRLVVPGEADKESCCVDESNTGARREASCTPDAIRREISESSSLSRRLLCQACIMYRDISRSHRLQLVDL